MNFRLEISGVSDPSVFSSSSHWILSVSFWSTHSPGDRNRSWPWGGGGGWPQEWGSQTWTPFSVGSHQHRLLQENSTEGLTYLFCCSANRFIFQLRAFFGPILPRLGALLFHNSFPAATSTFYALLGGRSWYPVALGHDMQNPFVFKRLNLTDLRMQIWGTLDLWAF